MLFSVEHKGGFRVVEYVLPQAIIPYLKKDK